MSTSFNQFYFDAIERFTLNAGIHMILHIRNYDIKYYYESVHYAELAVRCLDWAHEN